MKKLISRNRKGEEIVLAKGEKDIRQTIERWPDVYPTGHGRVDIYKGNGEWFKGSLGNKGINETLSHFGDVPTPKGVKQLFEVVNDDKARRK